MTVFAGGRLRQDLRSRPDTHRLLFDLAAGEQRDVSWLEIGIGRGRGRRAPLLAEVEPKGIHDFDESELFGTGPAFELFFAGDSD
jgi:hypothetical protein